MIITIWFLCSCAFCFRDVFAIRLMKVHCKRLKDVLNTKDNSTGGNLRRDNIDEHLKMTSNQNNRFQSHKTAVDDVAFRFY